ncbi:D-alanyl-D-alanine carboxypeptidase family protein, partial [Micromonospora solifontis]
VVAGPHGPDRPGPPPVDRAVPGVIGPDRAAGSQFAAGPVPAPGPAKRRRWLLPLVVVLVLAALLGSGVAVQLTRELPAATVTTSIASTLRVPGTMPSLPWPKRGSAELMIEGLGRLGGSGGGGAEPIGSVAKVMTAYVILKEHPLSGEDEGPTLTVTAADVADYHARIPSGQSLVPVVAGERLTERDALEALMLPSANNIAHQLAVWDAGSEAAFVDKMNAAADELGLKDTRYTDPSGFLPTTVSTAADQVILARAALKMPVFATIVELREATIPVAGRIRNYNDLLGVEGVFGIKTGSTDEAGGNLVFAARLKVGSRTLIVVGAVFNQPGANTPEQLAAVNTVVRRLLVAVRHTVKEYTLLAADRAGEVRTAWGATAAVSPAEALKVVGWPGLAVPVRVVTDAPGARVGAGQVVGSVEAAGRRVDLRTDTATAQPSLWWRLTRRP